MASKLVNHYLLNSAFLSLGSGITAVSAYAKYHDNDCKIHMAVWLLVTGLTLLSLVVCQALVIMGLYIENSMLEYKNITYYPAMFGYLTFLTLKPFLFLWNVVGTVWLVNMKNEGFDNKCPEGLFYFGYYMVVGIYTYVAFILISLSNLIMFEKQKKF